MGRGLSSGHWTVSEPSPAQLRRCRSFTKVDDVPNHFRRVRELLKVIFLRVYNEKPPIHDFLGFWPHDFGIMLHLGNEFVFHDPRFSWILLVIMASSIDASDIEVDR